MPSMGRIVLPNYPHGVAQRDHNRQVVFAAEQDYQRYISDSRELKDIFGVKVPFCAGAPYYRALSIKRAYR